MKGAHSHVVYFTSRVPKFPPTKSIFYALEQKHQYYVKIVHFPSTYCCNIECLSKVRATCYKYAWYLLLAVCVWRNHGADALLRVPLPLWSPYLPAFNPHLHSAAHISAHLDIPVYLSMGGPPGTKTNPLTPMQADPSLYLFIRFQEQAKSDRQFCSFCPMYERGRISWRVATWEERIVQKKKSPL